MIHDIGDLLAPFNHGEFAAALLEPFISEKNYWLVANHHSFQGYYYFEHIGLIKTCATNFAATRTSTTRSGFATLRHAGL